MKISIIGKTGTLASELCNSLTNDHQVNAYGKDLVDMRNPNSIKNITPTIKDSDVIIVCSGILNTSVNDIINVNATGPIELLTSLTESNSNSHVILIGSHAATWTSWPNIDIHRLIYNNSKKMLVNFVTGLEHSEQSRLKLTVYNVTRFKSNFTNDISKKGMELQEVVDTVHWLIDKKNPPLVYENSKTK